MVAAIAWIGTAGVVAAWTVMESGAFAHWRSGARGRGGEGRGIVLYWVGGGGGGEPGQEQVLGYEGRWIVLYWVGGVPGHEQVLGYSGVGGK